VEQPDPHGIGQHAESPGDHYHRFIRQEVGLI
jgi:hypothetical protein